MSNGRFKGKERRKKLWKKIRVHKSINGTIYLALKKERDIEMVVKKKKE